jgi:NitT/TauT family transport system substrate-binding protein
MRTLGALLAAGFLMASAGGAMAEPVKFVTIGHSYYSGPLFVAQQEKIFERHGLEASVTVVGGGPLALQAVLSKNADIGILSYEHVLTAAVQGKQVVSFFNIVNRPTSDVVASRAMMEGSKGLSLKDKVLRLKGKRIGVPAAAGTGDKITKAFARMYGLNASDFIMVFSGAETASYIAAFKRDLIDAAVVPEPAGLIARDQKVGDIYLDLMGGEVPSFSQMIFMTLVATPERMKERPDLIRKVAAVFAEAHRLMKSDPKRGIAIMKREYPSMDESMNEQLYQMLNAAWTKDGRMTEADGKATADYLEPKGDVPLDISKTFSNEFLPK